MAYHIRRVGVVTFIVLWVIGDDAEADEQIGASCRSGSRIDRDIVVGGDVVSDPGRQLRSDKVGGMKLDGRLRSIERDIVDIA